MKFNFTAYRYANGKFEKLANEAFIVKTVQELVNDPYVIRSETQTDGRVYYVGAADEVYLKLKAEGKIVGRLCDLFEDLRQELIEKGLPKEISIYKRTLNDIFSLLVALEVFPGATIVPEEEVQKMNAKGYFDPSPWVGGKLSKEGGT